MLPKHNTLSKTTSKIWFWSKCTKTISTRHWKFLITFNCWSDARRCIATVSLNLHARRVMQAIKSCAVFVRRRWEKGVAVTKEGRGAWGVPFKHLSSTPFWLHYRTRRARERDGLHRAITSILFPFEKWGRLSAIEFFGKCINQSLNHTNWLLWIN